MTRCSRDCQATSYLRGPPSEAGQVGPIRQGLAVAQLRPRDDLTRVGVVARHRVAPARRRSASLQIRLEPGQQGTVPDPAAEIVLNPMWYPHYDQYQNAIVVPGRHTVSASIWKEPAFARVPLTRLTLQLVQRTYRDLSDRGLSPKTIANAQGVLHKALEQAFRWRLLSSNVADLVDPPRVPRQQMTALSSEQARHVLAVAADDPLEPLWRLAVTCGLRQGELLALRWSEVDLDRGTLSVVATLEEWRDGAAIIAKPKTSRSRRKVELGDDAVEVATPSPTAESRHRVRLQPTRWPSSKSSHGWRRVALHRRRASVPAVRFHDLRHTAATLMLSRGIHPKIMFEMLGHSTVAITLDLYSHVTPTMQREAAALINDLLRPIRLAARFPWFRRRRIGQSISKQLHQAVDRAG